MSNELATLAITSESHPKLYFFLRHHPEILQLFHNIEEDAPLWTGIRLAQSDSADIIQLYIENLHLPLLLESKAIRKAQGRACGYEPLVSGLRFRDYDSTYTAKVAADRAMALAKMAKPKDNIENSLYCYYHGSGETLQVSTGLLASIRKLVLDYAANPDKDESPVTNTSNKFDLVISARITRHEEL
jgi:hypothetical protein